MIPKMAYLPFFTKRDATSKKIMESFKCPRFLRVKTTLKHCAKGRTDQIFPHMS